MADDSGAPRPTFVYRADVVEHLWQHGVHPAPWTPPEVVREFVRELYKYEIRKLRARMLRSEFPRAEYAGLVEELRRRYTVLSLLPRQFLAQPLVGMDLPVENREP